MREADLDSRPCQTKIRPKIRLEIVLRFGDQYIQSGARRKWCRSECDHNPTFVNLPIVYLSLACYTTSQRGKRNSDHLRLHFKVSSTVFLIHSLSTDNDHQSLFPSDIVMSELAQFPEVLSFLLPRQGDKS